MVREVVDGRVAKEPGEVVRKDEVVREVDEGKG